MKIAILGYKAVNLRFRMEIRWHRYRRWRAVRQTMRLRRRVAAVKAEFLRKGIPLPPELAVKYKRG